MNEDGKLIEDIVIAGSSFLGGLVTPTIIKSLSEDGILKSMMEKVNIYMKYGSWYNDYLDKELIKSHSFPCQTKPDINETASYYAGTQKENQIIEVYLTLVRFEGQKTGVIVVNTNGGATFTVEFDDGKKQTIKGVQRVVRNFNSETLEWI